MSFLNNGKSQSSLLILIFLVAIIAILYLLYLFSSASIQERTLTKTQLTKVSEYLDIFKGFSKESTLLASHGAAKEVAASGGDDGRYGESRSWICGNDRKPPTVDEVRYFLGQETKGFLNNFVSSLWVEDLPDVYFSNFTCSNIAVNGTGVDSGLFDEKYDANNFGSFVEVSLKNDTVSSTNDVSVEIDQVRFWFMYRIFKEWVKSTTYPQDVMSCINEMNIGLSLGQGGCDSQVPQGFRNCVERAADKAAKELENMFADPYVKCKYIIGCICAAVSPDCNIQYPCANCNREEAKELCSKKVVTGDYRGTERLLNKTGEQPFIFYPVDISKRYLVFNVDADIQWCNLYGVCGRAGDLSVWGAVSTTFSCKDTKYALSVS